jgi:hypothetical protein
MWRNTVLHQPLAVICRDTMISNIMALDWKIEPTESEQRDELKSEINYYSKFFNYTGEYDYTDIIEWIGKDMLDLPFGGAMELGRIGDDPNGKIAWIELLDGATLFPTLNTDYPVGQSLREAALTSVYFPYYAVNRVVYSPRTEIKRKGWGMAPPEKIYLALELLNRGDVYYANLLLETPSVGILDLGDMAKDSAEQWLQSWQTLLGGIDPFKIPVLYEHDKPATFIPFTRPPTEIMFDTATMKYASIVAAGYGMTLSDIGFSSSSNGGETLAGSIRQERMTRKTGFAHIKKKFQYFFNRMLPENLRFAFIDIDDELTVALGRARLANATAWSSMVTAGMFSAKEARLQTIADGLVSVSMPEEPPKLPSPTPTTPPGGKAAERPSMLGRPIAPSSGGQGEVLQSAMEQDAEFASLVMEHESKWEQYSDAERQSVVVNIQDYLDGIKISATNVDSIV